MYKFEFMGMEFETELECPFPGGFTAKAVDVHEAARLCEDSYDERVKLLDELAQVAWLMVNQRTYSMERTALDTYIARIARRTHMHYQIDAGLIYLECVKDRAFHRHKVAVARNIAVRGHWRDGYYLCGQCLCLHPRPGHGEVSFYHRSPICPSCIERLGLEPCPICGKLRGKGDEMLVWRMEDGEWLYDMACGACDQVRGMYPFFCNIHERWEIGEEVYYRGFGYGCEHGRDELTEIRCSMCGRVVYSIGVHEDRTVELFGHAFSGLCEDCERDFKRTERIARSDCRFDYGFKPTTVFFDDEGVPSFDDDGSLHMGFELELDGASDGGECDCFASEVHAHYGGFIYCKKDCSLDVGAESVSQPATPRYLIERFDWDELLYAADKYCLDNSSENCGFHVHMNRRFFMQGDGEDMNVAKLTILFDRFYDKFAEIGQREEGRAEEWARPSYEPMNESDFTQNERYKRKLEGNKHTRYHAVNTCNENTVEIRLFSATTNVVRLKFMLDVLQAVANMVVELPVTECLTMGEGEFEEQIVKHSIYEQTKSLL